MPLTPDTPAAIGDALSFALAAKAEADRAKLDSEAAAAAVSDAQAAAAAANVAFAAKANALDDARQRLDAILDVYLRPGAPAPDLAARPAA